jgi:flagellum-specific ATP synthase
LRAILTADVRGSVVQTVGLTVAVAGLPAPIGAEVAIALQGGAEIPGEVIGFRDQHAVVMPLAPLEGIRRGSRVRLVRTTRSLAVGPDLLGRVINARGACIDGRPQPLLRQRRPLDGAAAVPTERPRIEAPLGVGVRAIDALLTCGRGQRLGVFAGSGVGKSVLMGMMARHTDADVSVIALIGERGREVNEFVQRELGPVGLARSVVVTATSNEPALMRVQAAQAALTVAEYFRDQGQDVLLIMDSVTRFAMAQREIGLAAGEPPATRGYPPSVFALLPRLVERAGRTARGSVTAFFSVLVEGDDENEPIADAVRGLLDGHVWLSRSLAERGHYPAIDVLKSVSRLVRDLSTPADLAALQKIRSWLAVLADNADLLSIGAYRKGANPLLDAALERRDALHKLLQQSIDDAVPLAVARQSALKLANSP